MQARTPAPSSANITYDGPPSLQALSARLGVEEASLVKLDANENPYGPPPAAIEASRSVAPNRYPDAQGVALREAISRYTGAPAARIVLGNGSDELIDLVCRVSLSPGDSVITCPPTFVVFALAAGWAGAEVTAVPRQEPGLAFAIDAVLASVTERTRMVFLCSPNNPTGDSLGEAELRAVLATGRLVLLDEAYAEFSGRSYLGLTAEYDNLAVLRTFSKAFGLAGLRVGYGVLPEALARRVQAVRLPYNVNGAAQAAALAALGDVEWVEEHAALIISERARLFEQLSKLTGVLPLPSDANFLLVRVEGGPSAAQGLHSALLERGIMVRGYRDPALASYLRITTGTPEQNDALLGALDAILMGGKKSDGLV